MTQNSADIAAGSTGTALGAGHPFLLNGHRMVWLVSGSGVELFAVKLQSGKPFGVRRYLCTLLPGDPLFSPVSPQGGESVGLLVTGGSECGLDLIDPDSLNAVSLRSLLEVWLGRLAATELSGLHGSASGISPDADLTVEEVWQAAKELQTRLCDAVRQAEEDEAVQEAERLRRRIEMDEQRLSDSLKAFSLPGNNWQYFPEEATDNPLLIACRLIGDTLGFKILAPSPSAMERRLRDPLSSIARASGFRVRRVCLKGQWWRQDSGPLLVYGKEDNRPMALLQESPSRYLLHDPVFRAVRKVDAAVASELLPFASILYLPFPEGAVGVRTLLHYAVRNNLKDMGAIIALGFASGILGFALPVLTATAFDGIIPMARTGEMLQLGLALFVSAIASTIFSVSQTVAMQRIQGKADSTIQAALIDRLLALPVGLFRQYQIGDLTNRVLGINEIQQTVTTALGHGLLSSIFSVTSLVLLFYYSSKLALIVLGITCLISLIMLLFNAVKVRQSEAMLTLTGSLSSLVFQQISGIAKLKVAAAESRAYISWLHRFRLVSMARYRLGLLEGRLAVFNAASPVLSTMAIFALLHFYHQQMSIGHFLAFMAAFAQFSAGTVSFSTALMELMPIIPVYRRALPILQAQPEQDHTKTDPGDLTGSIEVKGVCFRYDKDGPLILNNISLQIHPGEFVAVVGRSGSGKSTLLRVLLGFETPESGSIYYDSQSIEGLDLHCLRRQIGVVLQDGQLMGGDIYSTIVGSNNLSHDDAWEAARMAGIADEIQAMPMEMFTAIPPGGSTISGGQRQRLMIARAMATKPGIFFFDEATSALDNISQAIVGESLKTLNVTRLVIAHRLSTILQADRILVMDQGSIVESGTHAELMARQGLFAELASRQIL